MTVSRMTKQRRIILEELRKVTSHPTAREVYEMVRVIIPNISLGTVYRNLEFLAEEGIIQRMDIGTGKRHYDGNPHEHNHIVCAVCGRIDDAYIEIGHEMKHKFYSSISETSGYEVHGLVLEFSGICSECKKAQQNKNTIKTKEEHYGIS